MVILGLLGLCLGETAMLAVRPTVVTIKPWTLSQDAQITERSASQSYIEAWGLALAELLGNVTPSTADFIATRLGPLLDPSIYHEVIDAVQANAEELRNDRVSMRFALRRVTFEKSTGKVFVTGTSYVRQGMSLESEKATQRTSFASRTMPPSLRISTRIRGAQRPLMSSVVKNKRISKTRNAIRRRQTSAAKNVCRLQN